MAIENANLRPPFKVKALVFYGRRRYISILQAYLERNLVKNGGILDQVIFVSNTSNPDDLGYLDTLLSRHQEFVKRQVSNPPKSFAAQYENLEDDVFYIKIDDDIVYIRDGTFEELVKSKLEHEWHIVSANVVNHPLLSSLYAHTGIMIPFALEASSKDEPLHDWRPSKLGSVDISKVPAQAVSYDVDPALRDGMIQARCLVGLRARLKALITGWGSDQFNSVTHDSWRAATVAHLSLLSHIEDDNLTIYDRIGPYDFHTHNFQRWSINFIGFFGRDINVFGPIPPNESPERDDDADDDIYLSSKLPLKSNKHCGVAEGALVAHYTFGSQSVGLLSTDILQRYRLLAKEICGQVDPFP